MIRKREFSRKRMWRLRRLGYLVFSSQVFFFYPFCHCYELKWSTGISHVLHVKL
uniref:Uncharacterized protein n=1 Tax=Anguilla anguilla TaxID=7936 RepID=A0A0E9UEA5_ANGAN